MSDPILGTFHDAETGETITRELTQEEIDALYQSDPLSPDA
jgi:hypothetical protein